MRILLSAYACEPGEGSEQAVGWHTALELARSHEVWVLTRANNQAAISAADEPPNGAALRFLYFDLPRFLRFWKRGSRGLRLYYYLWQLGALLVALRWHKRVRFDVAHHVTFAKYWAPSLLWLLPVPFIWGPVGGGESSPVSLWRSSGFHLWTYECARALARWIGEHDPLLLLTARKAKIAIAANRETAARVAALGAKRVVVSSQVALSRRERTALRGGAHRRTGGIRFVTVGNLLPLKGIHLAIRAYASAALPGSEFWIAGEGPQRRSLAALAGRLGIQEQVIFFGRLRRTEVFDLLKRADIFVFCSLHDSGGYACAEAMAAGLPVICLGVGGPHELVGSGCGIAVPPADVERTIGAFRDAMLQLAGDPARRRAMGAAAQRRVEEHCTWEARGALLAGIYSRT